MSPPDTDWRKRWKKNPAVRVLTSLKLTVTLLAFSLALVFFGTLDQPNIGINKAQDVYFESFFAVWEYPEEWPYGTSMALITHPENELAKKRESIAVNDPALKDYRFLGFIDNTFHEQISAVFEDSAGSLKPDPDLRYHTVKEIKAVLAKDEFKNGYAAILPDSVLDPPEKKEFANYYGDANSTASEEKDPELASITLEGQLPFTLAKLPVPLPGGYLLGGLLLLNLGMAALFRYPLAPRFAGIWTLHGGLMLMLVSELVTDLTEVESMMVIDEGDAANYSTDFHLDEFVLVDESDPARDHVLSVPADLLDPLPDDIGSRIGRFFSSKKPPLPSVDLAANDARFPFVLNVKRFYKNADLAVPDPDKNQTAYETRNRNGRRETVTPIDSPETFEADRRNFRAALVELAPADAPDKPIGTFFVSALLNASGYLPAHFTHAGKPYRIEMRPKRYHYPYQIELVDFRFLRYPGTDKPKDYSSDVVLRFPGEQPRSTRIYMNHPLNLQGTVFYQAGFDATTETQTRLQVVRNPGSILPYLGVTLVGLGLTIQFAYHLLGFARRRERKAAA